MRLGAPVDAGEEGRLGIKCQWLCLLVFRVAATLSRSLYWCSKARTPYGTSVTALTRGTGPPRRSKQQGAMGCSRGADSSRYDAGGRIAALVAGKQV